MLGRFNHGEDVIDFDTLKTAFPFLVGWYTAAGFLGGYGKNATGSSIGPAAVTAAKCWIVGIPVGMLIRSALLGYLPPRTFVAVFMAVSGGVLIPWRVLFARFFGQQASKARANRSGGLLEFFQLLGGLTKRW